MSFSWLNDNLFCWSQNCAIRQNFSFLPHAVRIPAMTFLFLQKKKEMVKVTLIGSFNICLFTETSTAPTQTVEAGISCEEEPSSVIETFCHSDQTTMQQHILDDVVILCSENGKKSRKQRIWECFTWYDGSKLFMQALLQCFPAK